MPRIPYDLISLEVNRLIIRMAVAPSWDEAHYYWDLYLNYIAACGWTDQEYDKETMRRIDAGWENIRRKIWN